VRNVNVVRDVVTAVVSDLVDAMLASDNQEFHVALTGGRAGGLIAREFLSRPEVVANPRLHIWWSDERFVPRENQDRNDLVLAGIEIKGRIHRIAGPDTSESIEQSALSYSSELHQFTTTRFCATNTLMDVTILSIGIDGHVASLFPHSAQLDSPLGILAITDSPKPPSQRVTWTFPTINASDQVWLIATGAEKKDAVRDVIAGAGLHDIPAAGAVGKKETRLYIDPQASSL